MTTNSEMKTWTMLIAAALIAASAWACGTDDNGGGGDCDDSFDAGGETYCVVEAPITETGFNCPADMEPRFRMGEFGACGPDGQLPADFEEAMCGFFADRGFSWSGDAEECYDGDGEPLPSEPIDSDGGGDACGVPGDMCGAGELCVQTMPPYCSTDWFGVCEPIPDGCDDVFDPVCGCDGTEYPNECDARASGYGGPLEPCDATAFAFPECELEAYRVPLDRAVDSAIADMNEEPPSCGCATGGILAYGREIDNSAQQALSCFCEAFASCSPAHLRAATAGTDSLLTTDYLVEQESDGCVLRRFHYDDFGGATDIDTGTCATLEECSGVVEWSARLCYGPCPTEATECNAEVGCYPMRASPYDEERGCVDLDAGGIVGCIGDEGGTDDEVCTIRESDGAMFVGSSGSVFRNSEGWDTCGATTEREVLAAPACE